VTDNYLHEIEREEYRDALRYTTTTPCYRHGWRADGNGGLICIECGESVDGSEA
jgi:hypothetical protein